METLTLRMLHLGMTDAKNELIRNSKDEIELFKNSFLIPENVNLENFLNLEKYFIYGLKGTGKTALLRYLALMAAEKSETCTTFVLFKTDFSPEDRKEFSRAASALTFDFDGIPDEEDFVNVWLWFFHRLIVRSINKYKLKAFEENPIWNKYKTCVFPVDKDEELTDHKFYPKLKHGIFEVGINFAVLSGKLGLNFEFANHEKTKIKFSTIVNRANELFLNLTPDIGSLYIFIDELELSLITKSKYNRDARIIRDVIVAIEKLNTISRRNKYNLYIIGAIRSEVLSAVDVFGKEVNKTVYDFGVPIRWNQSGGDIKTHPILKILLKRISSSEHFYNIYNYQEPTFEELWSKYFPKYIQEVETPMYILHQTWYRPRDVIRLLLLAQTEYPNNKGFDHQVFDAIRKQYSEGSWQELSEELRTTFKSEEIEGIKRMFIGFKSNFSLEEISKQASSTSEIYLEVKKLLEKHSINSILEKLYKIGFIGNEFTGNGKTRYRFIYRGDDEILLEEKMTIHRGLRPYLSIY